MTPRGLEKVGAEGQDSDSYPISDPQECIVREEVAQVPPK